MRDNTGEFLAAQVRPGNAGSNTADDHRTITSYTVEVDPDDPARDDSA